MIAYRKLIALIFPLLLSLVGCGGGDADKNIERSFFAVGEVVDTKEDGGVVEGDVSSNDVISSIGMAGNLSYSIAPDSGMQNGEFILNSDGTFTYTPNPDYSGQDSVDYIVSYADETATATLTINVASDFETLDEYGWNLEWNDEFNIAGEINPDFWTGVNANVAGGNLVLDAADGETSTLISVNAINKGRVEAKLRSAKGSGVSAALKLQPLSDGFAGDNQLSLIVAENGEVIAGAHYGLGLISGVSMNEAVVSTVADEFHTYAIEWGESKIRWYIDDKHVYTVDSLNTWAYTLSGDQAEIDNTGPFNQEMQIALELSAPSEALPAQLLVDYIKVWSCDVEVDPSVDECASSEKSKVSRAASDRIETLALRTTEIFTNGREDSTADSIASYLEQLSWHYTDNITELTISSVNDPVLIIETLEDDTDKVLDITNESGSASANIGIDGAELIGRDISLNFDLYIDSTNTTADNLAVKMQSGDSNGGVVNFDISELPQDTWINRSISLSEFIENPLVVDGEAMPLDPSNLTSLMVVEVDDKAHLQLDNINLSCVNSESCIQGPLALQTPAPKLPEPRRYQVEDSDDKSGVDQLPANDESGVDKIVANAGDYVIFEAIEAPGSGPYTIDYRVASDGGSNGFEVRIGTILVHTQAIPDTGGENNWTTITSDEFELNAGSKLLRIDFIDGNQHINWFEVQPPITEIRIEAEDFDEEEGIGLEDTTDDGGGQNIGWIEEGDYVEYSVTIPSDGNYLIEYRLAGASSMNLSTFRTLIGGIDVSYQDMEEVDFQEFEATGGWQEWTTQSSVVALDAGEQKLRLDFLDNEINVNWIKLTRQ